MDQVFCLFCLFNTVSGGKQKKTASPSKRPVSPSLLADPDSTLQKGIELGSDSVASKVGLIFPNPFLLLPQAF